MAGLSIEGHNSQGQSNRVAFGRTAVTCIKSGHLRGRKSVVVLLLSSSDLESLNVL
jgi:hypothetical protein